MIKNKLMLVFVLVLGWVSGCSYPQPAVITVSATPEAAVLREVIGPHNFPPSVNPLTGQKVDDPTVLQRRPLAVKISNAPDLVRPQAGIAEADLVFEHYTEGSLTRFTAIFWTHTPPRVGSIRSARLIDLELVAMYDALFAYSGASEGVKQRIADLPFAPRAFEGVSTGAPLYFREPGIEMPHNMFVVPTEVWMRASENGINEMSRKLEGMGFSDSVPAGGSTATEITVNYGPDVVIWTYDSAAGQYVRTVDGEPHTDANTGEQVTAANVVIIYAHHQLDLSIVESEWQGNKTFSTEIQIWTLGPATICRDGQMIEGYWMRWKEEDMLSFWVDEEMTQMIYLKPGNTWFEVVPLDFTGVAVK